MARKQKLELTWVGKGEEPKLEPRILIEDPTKSYGDPASENMLIHGDNLLALKALEQDYSETVKCVYIDPPYNTGSAFDHYDDGIEHSLWLSLMKPRLEIIQKLMTDDGLIFVQIDDNEQAYLKVLMDEIFGRENFITSICIKMSHLSGVKMSHIEKKLPKIKEFILLYAKNKHSIKLNPIYEKSSWGDSLDRYSQFIVNKDKEPSEWKVLPVRQAAKEAGVDLIDNQSFETFLVDNASAIFRTARNRSLPNTGVRNRFSKVVSARGLEKFVYNDEEVLFASDKLIEIDGKKVPANPLGDIWLDIGINNLHNEGGVDFRNGKKPEKLIERVLSLSTKPNDLVLDSFLGSGTTAAVAHKMGRKWIGIEIGDHANSHCLPRIKSIVDGHEDGGVTKSSGWNGGGGFKFYELAPSLLSQDSHGNWVISKDYDANMLAHAMAKQEGFTYQPSQTTYWQQGYSTEKDYIFTTTQYVSVELLESIHSEMQDDESLLIVCKAFDTACRDRYENITIKKIPQILLGRCEFGKDDYSLNISESVDDAETDMEDEE